MCLLLETIKVTNRRFHHLEYHQARVDQSRTMLFQQSGRLDLSDISIPPGLTQGVYKCRVVYGEKIAQIEFLPYFKKPVNQVKLVEADKLEYPFKYMNRSAFLELLENNPGYDELIIVRQGLITDTTYSNLAFYTGSRWYTPASPILKGTCRQRLLDEGALEEADITPADLSGFIRVSLINAMLELDELSFSTRQIR